MMDAGLAPEGPWGALLRPAPGPEAAAGPESAASGARPRRWDDSSSSEEDDEDEDSESEGVEEIPAAAGPPPPQRPPPPTATVTVGAMGPMLRQLRLEQGADREYYAHDHLERLLRFEARTPWGRERRASRRKVYCKDVHQQPCAACTTCHFCRQKTVDRKTWCPCALQKGRLVGGKSRGALCGSCLEMRFGENLDEALANPEWRCPVCRDICNCSGVTCLRARRNLLCVARHSWAPPNWMTDAPSPSPPLKSPTKQLVHEAGNMGYRSVAHYLILTHLTDGRAMPMVDVARSRRRPAAGAAVPQVRPVPPPQRCTSGP